MGWLFFNESFTLTASVFERALSVLNLIVFVSSFVQYEGLISSKGIAPAELHMAKVRRRGLTAWQYPTLCFLSTSDSTLLALHIAGRYPRSSGCSQGCPSSLPPCATAA
jgi:hypothetical protein